MVNRRELFKLAGGVTAVYATQALGETSVTESPRCGVLPIDKVVLYRGQVRCKVKFSYGKPDYFYFVLVAVHSGDYVGYGEGLMKDLKGVLPIAESLLGRDAFQLDSLVPDRGWNAPREAVSMALHDLAAKRVGVPLHVLLGGAVRKEIPLMPCLFPESPNDAAAKAKKFVSQGFRYGVKFKMVGDPDIDLPNLRAVRKHVPTDSPVLADANRGYKNYDEFVKLLPEFDKGGLSIFEDPLDGDFDQYKSLLGTTGVKIMMDVFARSEPAYRKILEAKCCDLINHHPNQQGGIRWAIMRSRACEIMGVPTWVGGTGYLGVGSAAYQHLASVIGLTMPCGELGGKYDHGFEDDIVKEPLPLKDGVVHLTDRPGLGVEIDEKSLAKLTLEEKTIS